MAKNDRKYVPCHNRSPVRKSYDSDMRRAEEMKSPVEKALDKLLGECIISFFSRANFIFFIQMTIPLAL